MPKLAKTRENVDAKQLTATSSNISYEKLTDAKGQPFVLSFHRKLMDGYRFDNLSRQNLKAFQGFLDKISSLTVNDVDKLYRCQPDNADIVDDKQVQHYEITKKFRLHGVLINGRFEVVRLDPNHNYHD